MNRRQFLKKSGVCCCGVLAGQTVYAGTMPGASVKGLAVRKGKNVVLIMADDLGVECLECFGNTEYSTPNLNALADSGMKFTNCHAQPLCTPSRVKLMTGMSNIRNYSHFSILEPDQRTFAHMLRSNGYRTAVAGKWQLYGAEHYGKLAKTGTTPSAAGFDEYCLWQVEKLGSRYSDPLIDRNGKVLQGTKDKYGPDICCDFLLDFIEKNQKETFFAYYPMILVHSPFEPTPDSSDPACKNKKQNFADMVAYMDKIIGRIIDKLRSLNLEKNTLVMFLGDNGTDHSITSSTVSGKIKGGKSLTTLAGTHVPLIVSMPGTVKTGFVCDDLIDLSDFMPTILDFCKCPLPEAHIDGRSFYQRLVGGPYKAREWIYMYYNPRPGNKKFPETIFAMDKRYKLYKDGRFYDISKDPLENFAITSESMDGQKLKIRQKLQSALDRMHHKPLKIEIS